MPSVNPGPAVTQTLQTVEVQTPVNTNINPAVQGSNALRLLAVGKAVPLTGLGDIAALPVINASKWAPATVAFTNGLVNGVSATIAAESLGIFTAPAGAGNVIRTAGVLTGQTASTVFTNTASPAAAVAQTAQTLYVNATVAVAGGVVDIFVYGYDLS
jgi:hypothetical protein